MSRLHFNLSIALILCLVMQGTSLSFASAIGVADCGMDMRQMIMAPMDMGADEHGHWAMRHAQTPPVPMSDTADCCHVDGISRSACTDMPDCHSCSSLVSLSIIDNTVTPFAPDSTHKRWLYPPSFRTFSPPDLWRPPIKA